MDGAPLSLRSNRCNLFRRAMKILVRWHGSFAPCIPVSSSMTITTASQAGIVRGGEAACPSAEVTRHELVADLRGPRTFFALAMAVSCEVCRSAQTQSLPSKTKISRITIMRPSPPPP